mmetsp:Transcript_14495/g.38246  ORF Transcript_14495/g.38246 Transcript_14495/m.38246 type:complete len:222 (+) Transcript_14495:583-1248(+)
MSAYTAAFRILLLMVPFTACPSSIPGKKSLVLFSVIVCEPLSMPPKTSPDSCNSTPLNPWLRRSLAFKDTNLNPFLLTITSGSLFIFCFGAYSSSGLSATSSDKPGRDSVTLLLSPSTLSTTKPLTSSPSSNLNTSFVFSLSGKLAVISHPMSIFTLLFSRKTTVPSTTSPSFRSLQSFPLDNPSMATQNMRAFGSTRSTTPKTVCFAWSLSNASFRGFVE